MDSRGMALTYERTRLSAMLGDVVSDVGNKLEWELQFDRATML